ncbi:MAG TPA: kinase [Anaerolineae bacterium]|nr:kinase [Anaerolineae bacterium]
MIISRTPFRVSFFGGGTDYPEWYRKEGGAVLSTSIDKYCYITCRALPPFFGIKHRVVWRHVETVESINTILHPAVKAGLRYLGFTDEIGLEIHYQGDLPARSGLGTSSAFVVGFIKAMLALRGETIDKKELARKAIELEKEVLKENVGSQDQVATAYGGFNFIQFHQDGTIQVNPVKITKKRLSELELYMMLFYIGGNRIASDIAKRVIENMEKKKETLRKMAQLVTDALALVTNPNSNLEDFGYMLNETWQLKRNLSHGVSTEYIDRTYSQAITSGAIGGKLLGAGGTGFMLLFVPEAKKEAVSQTLEHCVEVDFHFDFDGCTLLHYDESDKNKFEKPT